VAKPEDCVHPYPRPMRDGQRYCPSCRARLPALTPDETAEAHDQRQATRPMSRFTGSGRCGHCDTTVGLDERHRIGFHFQDGIAAPCAGVGTDPQAPSPYDRGRPLRERTVTFWPGDLSALIDAVAHGRESVFCETARWPCATRLHPIYQVRAGGHPREFQLATDGPDRLFADPVLWSAGQSMDTAALLWCPWTHFPGRDCRCETLAREAAQCSALSTGLRRSGACEAELSALRGEG